MSAGERQPASETFTLRLESKLKADFTSTAAEEDRSDPEVLRGLMVSYIDRQQRRRFEAEARRQSALAAESPDELELMRWIEDVSALENAR